MKTKSIILSLVTVVTLALYSTSVFAEPIPAEKEREFRTVFAKAITYPDFAKNENLNGFAVAEFTVTASGAIQVTGISATDPRLKEYVKTEMEKITVSPDKSVVGKELYYKFKFEMEMID